MGGGRDHRHLSHNRVFHAFVNHLHVEHLCLDRLSHYYLPGHLIEALLDSVQAEAVILFSGLPWYLTYL